MQIERRLRVALRWTVIYSFLMVLVLGAAFAFSASAATLGYGEFVGEYRGNPSQLGNDGVEDLLVATGDPRFADLGTSRQLDPAGKWDGDTSATDRNRWFTSYTNGTMTFALPSPKLFPYAYKDGDPIIGMWRYDGFEPGIGPGTAATDLFLAVKYSNRFSVFFLPEVSPGDTGFFSSDPRLIPGVDACTTGTTVDCMTLNQVGFNKKKKGYKKLAPYGLSNVTAYWPPVDASAAVPLPPSSLFLLTGILALGGIAGIRRIERERRRVEDTAD